MSPTILCIDGLIGAGKSSLLRQLANDYPCFLEPVGEWTLLPYLYQNPPLYPFQFQLQVSLSQFNQRLAFPEEGVVLVERCPWTSRHIFAPLLLSEHELDLYDSVHSRLAYPVDFFIYLDVDPAYAMERIQERSLADSRIPLDYLTRLHQRYTTHLLHSSHSVFMVDAHQPMDRVRSDVVKLIASISPGGT